MLAATLLTRYSFRKYPIDIFKIVVEVVVEMIPDTHPLCKAIDCRVVEPALNNRTLEPLRLENKMNTRKFSFIGLLTPPTESEGEAHDVEGREGEECSEFDTSCVP